MRGVEITADNDRLAGGDLVQRVLVEDLVKIELEFQTVAIGRAIRIIDVIEDKMTEIGDLSPTFVIKTGHTKTMGYGQWFAPRVDRRATVSFAFR